jgi:hypothetical protein
MEGKAMLLALLYSGDGELTAAAPACDQQPYGDRYWDEVHPSATVTAEAETAYVDIQNEELARRLLQGEFEDEHAAAEAVDAYLGLTKRRPR